MVTVDFTSSFFELDYLPNTTSDMIGGKLKNHFTRHCRPEYPISVNGPHYTSCHEDNGTTMGNISSDKFSLVKLMVQLKQP